MVSCSAATSTTTRGARTAFSGTYPPWLRAGFVAFGSPDLSAFRIGSPAFAVLGTLAGFLSEEPAHDGDQSEDEEESIARSQRQLLERGDTTPTWRGRGASGS